MRGSLKSSMSLFSLRTLLWTTKRLKKVAPGTLRASKNEARDPPRPPYMAPKRSQERPTSPQNGTRAPQERPKTSLRGPKSAQGAPRHHFETFWEPFPTVFENKFRVFCYTSRRCVALEKATRRAEISKNSKERTDRREE